MSNNISFQLVPKFQDNIMAIFIVLKNGESREVLRCIFPNDYQLSDNLRVAEEIIPILKRRYKRSI